MVQKDNFVETFVFGLIWVVGPELVKLKKMGICWVVIGWNNIIANELVTDYTDRH